jgi:hypothetical protein
MLILINITAGWVGFVLTTIGVILTAKKNILCWPVLMLANVFWTINLWDNTAAVLMQEVLFIFNIYGWIKWWQISCGIRGKNE